MILENNAIKLTHLVGGYYYDPCKDVLYSRHGADFEGLRSVNWTKKLRGKLHPHISKLTKRHGGKRKGAGRPKGSATKEPTKVIRVPLSKLEAVKKLVNS